MPAGYSAILEYELPMESRRPDVLLLVGAGVMVVELKGKRDFSQADIDQAAAYARDLRSYHRECANREVVAVLVPTRARGYVTNQDGVHVVGPDHLDNLVRELTDAQPGPPVDRARFLHANAYCPLPTLVEAARELFKSGDVRTIHRARAATDPAPRCKGLAPDTVAVQASRVGSENPRPTACKPNPLPWPKRCQQCTNRKA